MVLEDGTFVTWVLFGLGVMGQSGTEAILNVEGNKQLLSFASNKFMSLPGT